MIHATISGNIGKQPELKAIGQHKLLEFSLASNARQKVDGSWEKVTTWVRCALWRRAEQAATLLEKGTHLTVSGELVVREYTKRDGEKGYSVELDVANWELGPKRERQQHHERKAEDLIGPPEGWADDAF